MPALLFGLIRWSQIASDNLLTSAGYLLLFISREARSSDNGPRGPGTAHSKSGKSLKVYSKYGHYVVGSDARIDPELEPRKSRASSSLLYSTLRGAFSLRRAPA